MKIELLASHLELLRKIAEENGFSNAEIVAEKGSNKGDGYLGSIIKVVVKKGEKSLFLVLKSAQTNESFRNGFKIRNIYMKEIYIYEEVLGNFKKFQEDNGVFNGFTGYAKFFGKCEKEFEEALVLQNLFENNFKLWDRKSPMDSNHVELVIREYGKFHAVSFAMRRKQPELFGQIISKYVATTFGEDDKKNLINLIKGVIAIFPKAVKGNENLEKAVERVVENAQEFFASLMDNPQWLVVRHGDCWCNNMLFKYEDKNNPNLPTKVCLIDWQIARLGPPTIDLVYFFYMMSPKEILYDYMRYLKIYHESFSQLLKELSYDGEELYPYESFVEEFKKHSKFGLFLAPIIFRILLVDSEEAPDLENQAGSIDEFFEVLRGSGEDEAVQKRLVDLLQFMVDNNLV